MTGSDLRGLTRLTFDGIAGFVDVVEAIHYSIASGPPFPGPADPGRTRGITGMVRSPQRRARRCLEQGVDGRVPGPQPAGTKGQPQARSNSSWSRLLLTGTPGRLSMAGVYGSAAALGFSTTPRSTVWPFRAMAWKCIFEPSISTSMNTKSRSKPVAEKACGRT